MITGYDFETIIKFSLSNKEKFDYLFNNNSKLSYLLKNKCDNIQKFYEKCKKIKTYENLFEILIDEFGVVPKKYERKNTTISDFIFINKLKFHKNDKTDFIKELCNLKIVKQITVYDIVECLHISSLILSILNKKSYTNVFDIINSKNIIKQINNFNKILSKITNKAWLLTIEKEERFDSSDIDDCVVQLLNECFCDPYDAVSCFDSLLSYNTAKNIEYNLKLPFTSNKITAFFIYTLSTSNSYDIDPNTKLHYSLLENKNNVNIKSHIISIFELIYLFLLEFRENVKTKDEAINMLNTIMDDFTIFDIESKKKIKDECLFEWILYSIKCLDKFVKYFSEDIDKLTNNIKNYNSTLFIKKVPFDKYKTIHITPTILYKTEKKILEFIKDKSENKLTLNLIPNNSVTLNKQQELVCNLMNKKEIVVVFGGPGTGKTYTVSSIITENYNKYNKIIILAPTASASKNMYREIKYKINEKININLDYYTIDKFINTINKKNSDEKNSNKYNLYIIDEISMMTYKHLYGIMKKIRDPYFQMVLIGDENQLPCIGLGDICRDFKKITENIVYLTENQRSKNSPNIIENIENCKHNKELNSKGEVVISTYTTNNELDKLIKLTYNYNDNEKSIIIAQTNEGTKRINKIIQEMNKSSYILDENNKEMEFKINDKIICCKNIYDDDGELVFCNGDEFKIHEQLTTDYKIEMRDTENTAWYITLNELRDFFTLSYCYTCHKSQGKSIKNVYYIIENKYMMTNKLSSGKKNLYTGISRPQEKLFIFKNDYIEYNDIYNSNYNKKTLLDFIDTL